MLSSACCRTLNFKLSKKNIHCLAINSLKSELYQWRINDKFNVCKNMSVSIDCRELNKKLDRLIVNGKIRVEFKNKKISIKNYVGNLCDLKYNDNFTSYNIPRVVYNVVADLDAVKNKNYFNNINFCIDMINKKIKNDDHLLEISNFKINEKIKPISFSFESYSDIVPEFIKLSKYYDNNMRFCFKDNYPMSVILRNSGNTLVGSIAPMKRD